MIRIRFLVLIATVVFSLAGGAAGLGAQPDAGCGDATPRAIEEIVALAFPSETAAASPATPMAEVAEAELPQGEPVDASTAAEAEQVVQNWLACLLAGQDTMVFAYMTDDLATAFLQEVTNSPNSDTPEELSAMLHAGPEASPSAGTTVPVATPGHDLRVLADGRIGGIWAVEGDNAFFILEQQDGTWLVDEVIDITDE